MFFEGYALQQSEGLSIFEQAGPIPAKDHLKKNRPTVLTP